MRDGSGICCGAQRTKSRSLAALVMTRIMRMALLFQVHPRHWPPPRPIVIAMIAPDCQFMANATRTQNRGKLFVLLPAHVPLAGGEDGADVVVAPAIRAVGQVIGRIVEV